MEVGIEPGGGRPDAYFGKLTDCGVSLAITNDAFSSHAGYNGPSTDPNVVVDEYKPCRRREHLVRKHDRRIRDQPVRAK